MSIAVKALTVGGPQCGSVEMPYVKTCDCHPDRGRTQQYEIILPQKTRRVRTTLCRSSLIELRAAIDAALAEET